MKKTAEPLTQYLPALAAAASHHDGLWDDGTPSVGTGRKLAKAGLFDTVERETFFGGVYRINDKGRDFLKKHQAPDWW